MSATPAPGTSAAASVSDHERRAADARDRHRLYDLMLELAVIVHRVTDLRRWTSPAEAAHLDAAVANCQEAIRSLQLDYDRRTGADPATPADESGPVVTVAENSGNRAAGRIALDDPHAAPGERGPLAWFIGTGATDRPHLKFESSARVPLNVDGARRLAEELVMWADIHQPSQSQTVNGELS